MNFEVRRFSAALHGLSRMGVRAIDAIRHDLDGVNGATLQPAPGLHCGKSQFPDP